MKNLLNFLSVIIVMGSVLFIFFKYCDKPNPEVIIKKTVRIRKENYKPKVTGQPNKVDISKEPEYIIKYAYKDTLIIRDTIYKTDTVKIYNDYYTKYSYLDTILNDSNGFVLIKDTIYQNSIYSRTTDVKIHNTEKTIYQDNNGLYLSLGIMNLQEPVYSANLDFKYKKLLFGTGFNTNSQLLFKIGYKIK